MDVADRDEFAATADIEQACRTFVEHATDGIAVLQGARFVFASRGVVALGGRRAEELIGMHVVDVFDREELPSVLARCEDCIPGEPVESRYEIRIRRPDGETRWARISVVAMLWDGRPASLCLVIDVTARKDLEARLKGTLGAIFSSTEILRCYAARLAEDDREDLYDRIEAGVRDMTVMVENALARSDSG